ncbi:MAG: serine/threonine-protein phosphatase, partial [Bacteroidota bacterium]|nr:serine/threonine-protein phosphatase [Bacteroidota bacterium]
SVVCSNALNRSVKEFNLREPGKILDKTKELVVDAFNKSEEEVKDGMDISLLRIILNSSGEATSAEWSGANNPLWIIRNGEMLEFKADKQPIGQYMEAHPFTTHRISLLRGDLVFLFTDGFQDQFGEANGKKFKSAQLRKMFLSFSNKQMDEQKTLIENTFHTWKGKFEQVDDVCIIGVRL